jgi:hypothetical protein
LILPIQPKMPFKYLFYFLTYNLLKKLLDNYPQFFDNDKLENELRVLYSDPGILVDSVEIREKLKFITDFRKIFQKYCNLSTSLTFPG